MPKDNKSGFMGYKIVFDNMKLPKYGVPAIGSQLFFGNSGIDNMIPYLIEGDHFNTWATYLVRTKVTKKIDSTRFIISERYELPFPLSNRETECYMQVFNNLEVNGTM